MNCDMGNKTEIFHKAQRRSGAEHDDMSSKPLWGIHVPLFARDEGVERCVDRCCICYVLVRQRHGGGEGSPKADGKRKKRDFFLIWTRKAASTYWFQTCNVSSDALRVQMCWLEDTIGMRKNLNDHDGWSGWNHQLIWVGLFFFSLSLTTNRSGYEKLVSLGPLVDGRVGPWARSWRSVARKSPTAEIHLITAQDPSEKQRQEWELFLGKEWKDDGSRRWLDHSARTELNACRRAGVKLCTQLITVWICFHSQFAEGRWDATMRDLLSSHSLCNTYGGYFEQK